MLAVQFHQRVRQPPQHLARHAPVVDPAGLATVGGVDPAQDQLVAAGQARLLQHRAGGMALWQVEDRHDLALLGPLPHQFGPSPPAQHEAQRVQQDRLARAGFAGQHVEPGLEGKFQPVDDQHVANIKRAQHGCGLWQLAGSVEMTKVSPQRY